MATLLYPGKEFKITHQEMIKGISRGQTGKKYCYHDELIVPIIENTPEERDLTVCHSNRAHILYRNCLKFGSVPRARVAVVLCHAANICITAHVTTKPDCQICNCLAP